jgi:hypothetical protein
MGGAEGVGSTWGMVPVRRHCKASTAHFLRSVARPYPVTPLGVFALGCRFDRWDAIKAINAPNLGRPVQACRACQKHAGMDTLGPAG